MNIPGLGNLQKQMVKMQEDMARLQEDLDKERLETSSGGGAVRVVTTGMGELLEIHLSKDVVDPDDIEMLQDTLVSALRDALKKAQDHHTEEMGKITGGIASKLPGLGFPM
jgi:DNA-binding YbaB/EbfC family protein